MTIQRKLDDLANTTARALDGDPAAVAHVAERLHGLSPEERAQLEARAIARKVPMPAPDNLMGGGGANLRILRGLCQPPGDLDGEDLDFWDDGWGHSPPKGDPFADLVTLGPAPALLPDGSPHTWAGRDSEAEAQEQRERRRRRRADILDQWNRLGPRDREDLLFLEIVDELVRKPGTLIIDDAEKERMIERLLADFRRGAIGEARSLADPDKPFTPADMIEAERLPIAPIAREEAKELFRLQWVYPLIFRRDAMASYFRAYGIPWPSAWGPAPAGAGVEPVPYLGFYKAPPADRPEGRSEKRRRHREIAVDVVKVHREALQRDVATMIAFKEDVTPDAIIKTSFRSSGGWETIKRRARGEP
jgi:hypothetical protein